MRKKYYEVYEHNRVRLVPYDGVNSEYMILRFESPDAVCLEDKIKEMERRGYSLNGGVKKEDGLFVAEVRIIAEL